MNVSNHVLAGGIIALLIPRPAIALPLAFISHFILDALPHFGYERQGFDAWRRQKLFYLLLLLDSLGLALVVGLLMMNSYWLALLAGFVAAAPDSIWVYRYLRYERKGLTPPTTYQSTIHIAIQWCERRWGLCVEVVFFIALYYFLYRNFT